MTEQTKHDRRDIKLIIDRCIVYDMPAAADLIKELAQQLAAKDGALRQSREAFRYLAHCISNRPVLQGLIQKSLLAIDKELKP